MLLLFTLVYNNSDYLVFQEKVCRTLASSNYCRVVVDSSEDLDERERVKSLSNTIVIDGRWINKYRKSEAHGVATNFMMNLAKSFNSEYSLILDLDIVPLVPDWDKKIVSKLEKDVDALGVPYNPLHGNRRLLDMPTVFFFAFKTKIIANAKLDWRTKLPTDIRLKLYWFYRKLNKFIFTDNQRKFFDFEMGQFALYKMKWHRIKTNAFEMKQPWESDSKLKFDIGHLPKDRSKVDPLVHEYPEEWHSDNVPFVTHQRRSTGKTFNKSDYSKNWVKVLKEYIHETYGVYID